MLELVQEILIHFVLLVLGIDLDGIGVEMLLQYSEVFLDFHPLNKFCFITALIYGVSQIDFFKNRSQ